MMLKNIPKSKIGAALTGLYLIIVAGLIGGVLFGGGGLHGNAAVSMILLILLTSPLSWVLLSLIVSSDPAQNSGFYSNLLIFIGLPVCALVNACALYLMGWLAGRMLQSLFFKTEKPLK